MLQISRIYFLLGLIWAFTACTQNQTPAVKNNESEPPPSTQVKLFGQWKSTRIESSYAPWKGLTECNLFVYEDKILPSTRPASSGEPLLAELILTQDGTNRLVDDTQPVFATRDKLYLGPIGSCYRFDYQLSDPELRLNLLTDDGGYLRLRFIRVATDPGKPRFPEVSKRWR